MVYNPTIKIDVVCKWAVEKPMDRFCKNEFFEFHLFHPNFTEYFINHPTEIVQTFRDDRSHIIKKKVRLRQASKMYEYIGQWNPIGRRMNLGHSATGFFPKISTSEFNMIPRLSARF